MTLNKSQRIVLEVIRENLNVGLDEVKRLSELETRTILYALKALREKKLIKRVPTFVDMRKSSYVAI